MRHRGMFFIGLALVLVVLVAGGYLVIRQQNRVAPVTISCVGGSEKSDFMHDPDVVRILKDRYGLTVTWQSMGSYDQVLMSTDEITQRGWDCLWPSSASAQHVFEAKHPGAFAQYRAETALQSPEVVYAGPQGTDALVKAGLVEQRNGTHYIVDARALLLDQALKGGTWQALQAGNLKGPINISSTDPVKSNSGFTLAQLELTMVATPDASRPPTPEEARRALPTMRTIYDAQGLQATSSDNGFRQWLTQGGEYQAPLYAGYENQIIQQVTSGPRSDAVLKEVRILYPEPTIYSDHPVLALNADAGRLIDALQDEDLQTLAWKRYGFRSATNAGLNNVADFSQIPLAPQFRTIPAPNSEVTLALLGCLQDRTTCG
ncbi:hypothetical protein [Raineyella sp. LH-20]|uniref:hypothetical protein n=1 Tax=Raineyella sp. LH-20 TaxID=3081204 RepID=UPI002952F552|nr:hypothetical protein [Raineyella sp. LH-20]WOP18741.1 hypothetical protein R0146_00225 [Raineyella sp. LH-20]